VTAVLALALALQRERWRSAGLYLGFLAAAVGMLFHFDAVSALPPMGVLTWYWWRKYRSYGSFPRLRLHLFAAAALAALPIMLFYFEYAVHVGPHQTGYWTSRFTGKPTDILQLFQFYNPGPVVWLLLAMVVIGLTRLRFSVNWQVILAWLVPP
jgi:hypothetical protein